MDKEDPSGQHAKPDRERGFIRRLTRSEQIIAALIGAVGVILAAILPIALSNSGPHPPVSASPTPRPTITSPTATAPGTASSSGTTTSSGTSTYYQGAVTIAANGRDFDTSPPGPGPGAGAFYYNSSALETGGSNTAGLAVWRQGGTPTAAECTTFATANMISDVPNVNAGMKICFRTDQGRSGLLSVQPGTSANELIAIATVWDH
jgi:hypothetical protein